MSGGQVAGVVILGLVTAVSGLFTVQIAMDGAPVVAWGVMSVWTLLAGWLTISAWTGEL